MEFSRQKEWSGSPFPTPGDLPDPGVKLPSLASPSLTGRFLPLHHLRRPLKHSIQFSSVAQSCPTLCNPTDCSTPASSSIINSQSLLKLMSIELVMPSNLLLPLQSFPASGSSQMSQFFTSGGQRIGVSASASVLPMNIQD